MDSSLIKEEEKRYILKILPTLLREDAEFKDSLYEILGEVFTKKDDFSQLRDIVNNIGIKLGELTEAQKKTEIAIKELIESQKKTDIVIKELKESQKKTDIVIKELKESQKKTDIAIKELTEAQKKTDIKLGELVVAQKELTESQKRFQEELHELVREHKKTRKQLGGLSITVGYRLEDEAFKALPGLLERDYGIEIENRLKRQYVVDNEGKYIEVNIVGKGKRNGKEITIIGEAKAQLSKNDVDNFLRKKIKKLDKVYKEIFPILITYMISEPDTEKYVKSKGITIYYSYEF